VRAHVERLCRQHRPSMPVQTAARVLSRPQRAGGLTLNPR
jgi:hypothetical protein